MFQTSIRHALILLLVSASTGQAADGWLESFDAAKERAAETSRPILLHFHARWCGPCRNMEQTVLNQRQVLTALDNQVVGVKVNIDDYPELASQYNIHTLPSDVIVEPDGTKIMESSGARTLNEYLASIQRASTRYRDLVVSRQAAGSAEQNDTIAMTDAMLGGYCPYILQVHRRWEKGSPSYAAQYQGQTYHLSSEEALENFRAHPERYAPRYLGCDPVIVWETDRALPGSIRYGAFYDDELYLFVSDENRRRFKADPDQFVRTRVVLHVNQIETVVR